MNNRLHRLCFSILTLAMLQLTLPTNAQSLRFGRLGGPTFEVGINIGPSFFLGDLGGNRGEGTRFIKDVNLSLTNLMYGGFFTVYPNDWLGVRAAAQFGRLEGEDEVIEGKGGAELYRKQRNLDFRTNIFEAYVAAEIYPLNLLLYHNMEYKPRWQPYGVLGVGMYTYNPQGSLTDGNGNMRWYDLKPLHLEGQGFDEYPDRKEYALTQINIPIGAGVKYLLSDRVNISLELLLRKSFNDYVDDVSTTYIDPDLYDKYLPFQEAQLARKLADKMHSIVNPNVSRFAPGEQRGNPNQNDSWFTTFLKFGIRLGPINDAQYSMRRMRCPVRF